MKSLAECRCAVTNHGLELNPIVFGVHPEVLKTLNEPAVIIQQRIAFCHEHWPHFKRVLFVIVENVCGKKSGEISHNSNLEEGLGCWITFESGNFQLSYHDFKRVYQGFMHKLSP